MTTRTGPDIWSWDLTADIEVGFEVEQHHVRAYVQVGASRRAYPTFARVTDAGTALGALIELIDQLRPGIPSTDLVAVKSDVRQIALNLAAARGEK